MIDLSLKRLTFAGAVLLLAGCASPAKQPTAAAISTPEASLLYNTLVAEMAGHHGDLGESVRYYRKVIHESNQPSILRRAVRIMMFAKDYAAAAEAMGKWLELAPENMEAHQLAAMIALFQKDSIAASRHLEWMLAHSGKQGFKVLAAFLDRLNQPDLALAAMESILSRHADNADAQILYARLAFDSGDYEKSRLAASRAVDLNPAHTEAQIIHTRSRIESGEVEQSLTDLAAVVNRYPKNHDLRLGYARLLVTSSRFESAVEQFEVLIKAAPDNVDLLYSTALVMLQIKRFSDAERHLEKLTTMPGHRQAARYYLGKLEEDRKNFEKALAWYQQVEEGTLYVESQMSAARIQAKSGDVGMAREVYQRLRQSHKQMATKIWLGESEMLGAIKQYNAAYELLNQAVGLNPDDMDLLYSRALAAEKVGRIDILERDLKKVLTKDPKHAHALNALGYTLADRTDRYAEALEYIKRALELAPTDPAIIDSMGWVLYRMGRQEEALTYLRRAFANFRDGEIAAHLGEVLWVSGREEAAIEIWDKALDTHPDSEVLLDVIRRFNP